MLGDVLDHLEPFTECLDHFAHQHLGSGGAGGDPDPLGRAEPVPVDVGRALDQPRRGPLRSATSASRSELLLFGAPITSSRSHFGAMDFTAAWRLDVA